MFISHLLPDEDMQKVIEQKQTGIESIEFSISDNLDQLDYKIKQYQKRLIKFGNPKLTLHGPFMDMNQAAFDKEVRKITKMRFNQAYTAASKLNAEKIIFHSGFIPGMYYLEGWADRLIEFWNDFFKDKTADVQVLMENVLDPEPEEFLKIKQGVSATNFNLCLDVGHANCYSNYSPEQWVTTLGESIGHVHLHDNYGKKDSHNAFGDGNIHSGKVLQILQEKAPEATYTVECTNLKNVMTTLDYVNQVWIDL